MKKCFVSEVISHSHCCAASDDGFSKDIAALEECNLHHTFIPLHIVNKAVHAVAQSLQCSRGLFVKASECLEQLNSTFKSQIRSRAILYLHAFVTLSICIFKLCYNNEGVPFSASKSWFTRKLSQILNWKKELNVCLILVSVYNQLFIFQLSYSGCSNCHLSESSKLRPSDKNERKFVEHNPQIWQRKWNEKARNWQVCHSFTRRWRQFYSFWRTGGADEPVGEEHEKHSRKNWLHNSGTGSNVFVSNTLHSNRCESLILY